MRISFKVSVIFTALLLVIVSLVSTLIHRQNSSALIERELKILSEQSLHYHRQINTSIQSFIDDTLFISNIPPVQGIIRALKAEGTDPKDGSSMIEWRARLDSVFEDFIKTHPAYFQLRFIGVEDNGRELIRVDRKDGEVFHVKDAQLQQKGGRDYFLDTIKLKPGDIYLSEINLNREHGQISQPVTRTLRVSTPVYDAETQGIFGIVIINVDIGPTLDVMEAMISPPAQIFLLNNSNYFLIHPENSKEFSFDYDGQYQLGQELPFLENIRSLIPDNGLQDSSRVILDEDNVVLGSNLKISVEGYSSQDKELLLIIKVPKQAALAEISQIRNNSVLLTLILLVAGIFLILLFARKLVRPLEQITKVVENYQSGVISLDSLKEQRDEMGTLARAFNDMTERIAGHSFELAEREKRLTSVMDTAVDCIVIIDDQGIIDMTNPALEKLFGYSSDELKGQNIKILASLPHRDKHDGYIADYLAGGTPGVIGYGRELFGIHKNGAQIPLHISVSEFMIGNQRFFSGVIRDIRQQKRTEQQIMNYQNQLEERVQKRTEELSEVNLKLKREILQHRETNEQLNLFGQIFENTREGILVTDANETIIEVNNAFTRITLWERTDVLGETPRITQSGRHGHEFYQQMWLEITSNGFWSGEIWDKRKNGEIYPKWLSINSVTNQQGTVTHYVGIFTDISRLKETEKRLEQLAYYDALTGLPNRSMLNALLEIKIGNAARTDVKLALLFIDLDRFKYVNDTLGHSMGDLLLTEISERLKSSVRQSDLVVRQGGDEFVVVMEISDIDDAARVANKIIELVSEVVHLGDSKAYVGASIGIGIYPDDAIDIDTLIKSADIAMYQAKDSGRNQYCFFESSMNDSSNRRLELEHALRNAIDKDQFSLLYQPKIDIKSGRMNGVEALVRWNHPEQGTIPPDEFIGIAEDTGLIIQLGEWVMRTACTQAKKWQKQFKSYPLRLSVNLSMRQFQAADLANTVRQALKYSGLPADLLELEITESMVISDVSKTVPILKQLRALGLSISIDDFGTGYSSLSYLKRLPIQHLKIDRSFVRDIAKNEDDASIIRAIISLGNSLDLNIIAEGVEDEHQLKLLKELQCDEYQGFYFSKPVSAEEITEILSKDNELL